MAAESHGNYHCLLIFTSKYTQTESWQTSFVVSKGPEYLVIQWDLLEIGVTTIIQVNSPQICWSSLPGLMMMQYLSSERKLPHLGWGSPSVMMS